MAKAAKKTGKTTKVIGKKPMSDAAALRAGYIIKSVTLITGGGWPRTEELRLIKTANYRATGTRFLIHTSIDEKKKKLVMDALELHKGQQYQIRALRQVQPIKQLDLKADQYENYSNMLGNIKSAIDGYTISAEAQLARDIRNGKYMPARIPRKN